MKKSLFLILWALIWATPAFSADDDEKFYYFHNSDITKDVFISDYQFCGEYAGRVDPPQGGYIYTPNLAAAAAGGFAQGLLRGSKRRMMFHAVMRRCMAMRGYSRYSMQKAELKLLWEGGWEEAKIRVAKQAIMENATGRLLSK